MKNRTYRYMEKEPLYPFGFGLSYTTFQYSNLILSAKEIGTSEQLTISVDVQNTGKMAGEEVVQLYLTDLEASVAVPKCQLRGIQRIHLAPGEKKTVTFTLTPRQMALIDNDGRCILEPGAFKVSVGGCQPDERSKKLGGTFLTETFEVKGSPVELPY